MIFTFSLQELLQCITLINDDIRQKIMSQLDKTKRRREAHRQYKMEPETISKIKRLHIHCDFIDNW